MLREVRSFNDAEDAAVSVEAVFWMPVFILILGVVFGATVLMISRTEMWSIANDTSRMVALGRMSDDEAEDFIEESFDGARGYQGTVTETGEIVTTVVTRPFRTVGSIGIIASNSVNLTAISHYRVEPTS